MEEIINGLKVGTVGLVSGFLGLFGGDDTLLYALTLLVVLDFITGYLKSRVTPVKEEAYKSAIMHTGITKKVFIFIMVAVAQVVQSLVGDSVPIRDITVVFYLVNEALSILENIDDFLPIPKKLTELLLNSKKKDDE